MSEPRIQGPLLLLLMGVGAILRLQVADEIPTSPVRYLFENPSTDMKTFLDQSAAILEDPLLRREAAPFYQSPFYPYYLASLRKTTGGEPAPALRRQALLDCLAIPATYGLGRMLLGPWAALAAAAMVTVHGQSTLHASIPLSATLETTLGTLFLALLLLALPGDRRRDWMLAGVAGGLAALARPNFLVLLALIPVALWARRPAVRDPVERSRIYKNFGILITCLVLPLALLHLPVVLRNLVVSSQLAVLPTSGSVNFRIGNSEGSSAGGFHYPEGPPLRLFSPSFVKLNLHKLVQFYNTFEWPQNMNYTLCREYLYSLQLPLLELWLLMPLAVAGAGACLVAGDLRARLLVLGLFLSSLSISLFFVVDRFRLPLVPGYAVLAAALLLGPPAWRRRAPFWLAGLFLIPLLHRPPPRLIRYNDHGLLQDVVVAKRDWISGIPIAERFVRDYPEVPDVTYVLGSSLMVAGRREEGERWLRAALDANPDFVPALRDLIIYYRDVLRQPERAADLLQRLKSLGEPEPPAAIPR